MVVAEVKIWGELVGAIAWDEVQELGSFEYYPKFANQGWDLAPLTMPISRMGNVFTFPGNRRDSDSEYNTFKGLPGLIADSLPDAYGNQLIEIWLAQQGRSPGSMNPIETLCFIGKRSMGALEFEPAQYNTNHASQDIEIASLVEITGKMLNDRQGFYVNLTKDELKAMQDMLRLGTSAGGARPKALIAYNEKTSDIKSGQGAVPEGYSHWLLKLDGVSNAQFGASYGYGRVEMAYYHMAIDAGIEMMPCQLLEEGERAHFMTQRYDRSGSNTKHHIQTWCAMNHYDFNTVGVYSYEQLFQTMRSLLLPYPQAEQMYRRMVFNVLARNCDDHTKNFSFRLQQGKEWELAPAYDICHAYNPTNYWVSKHNISINGKRENITRKDLYIIAESMNIKKPKKIIDEVAKIVSNWMNYAEEINVSVSLRDSIQKTLIVL